VKRTPFILVLLGALAAGAGCDVCDAPLAGPGNQDSDSLALCPPLPPGVAPIDGLAVAHAADRFGGVLLTLTTRALACGESAAQHDYCDVDGARGVTIGLPEESTAVGAIALGYPVFVEYETADRLRVGGGIDGATLEIFAITDTCVTGRIVGLLAAQGPFDGGFLAPRCSP
jgi:hypothetical protein